MIEEDYSKKITVNASPANAYVALTQEFDKWWTTPDNPIQASGDIARFSFPPGNSYWTFQATNLVPGGLVELKCVEANHLHEAISEAILEEWLGSTLSWNIYEEAGKTVIHFEHTGLTPNLHCYDVCEAGWNYFFAESLKAYLDTGVGQPHVST